MTRDSMDLTQEISGRAGALELIAGETAGYTIGGAITQGVIYSVHSIVNEGYFALRSFGPVAWACPAVIASRLGEGIELVV